MLISLVVVNWNRKKDTLQCLESLEKLNINFRLEIVIVDNASTDDSEIEIKKFLKNTILKRKDIRCEYIKNKYNLGFSGGNNVGISHALNHGADFVLLLNNDTFVDKNFLVNLVKTIQKHPKAGILSPKIYFAPGFEYRKELYKKADLGNVIWYAGGDIDWDNIYGSNHGVDEVDKGQFEKVRSTDFATGACMLLNRKLLEEVGSFDEKYYLYFEDADLSIRAKKKGWEVLYAPEAYIWHKVSQSSGIGGPLNDYFITRNRLLFGMRYAKLRTRLSLYRESLKLFWNGRKWQKKGILDYYFGKYGRGSWK